MIKNKIANIIDYILYGRIKEVAISSEPDSSIVYEKEFIG
jgi:hypothetical protein